MLRAFLHVWDLWYRDGASRPPVVTAILQLREFIVANQARFINVVDEDTNVPNLAGYYKFDRTEESESPRLYLLTESSMREAVQGIDTRSVARELKERGYLFTNDQKWLQSKHVVRGSRPYFYAVRRSILEYDG